MNIFPFFEIKSEYLCKQLCLDKSDDTLRLYLTSASCCSISCRCLLLNLSSWIDVVSYDIVLEGYLFERLHSVLYA